MKKKLLAALASLVFASGETVLTNAPFLEKPYLQLGDAPKLSLSESLVLIWQTDSNPADWTVEVRTSKDSKWRAMESHR